MLVCAPAVLAADLTGTVTNRTTGRPAAGADVILLKLAEGMDEAGRTKTDAQGRYRIALDNEATPHLVRVVFQDVTYHKSAPPGTPAADIEVFNSAPKVAGVRTSMNIIRFEPQSTQLTVTELYVVKNDSKPPRTQMSDRNYIINIPPGATIDGALIATGTGLPLNGSAIPGKKPGEYAFMFPLRPGETRFQITYHMPYRGSLEWKPAPAGVLEHYVVMVPKGVELAPADPSLFEAMPDEQGATVRVATNVQPNANVSFKISGTGTFPAEPAQGGAPGAAGGEQPGGTREGPGGGIGKPIDSPNPLQRYMWWILGGFVVVLAAGAWFFYQQPSVPEEPELDPTKPVRASKAARTAARTAATAKVGPARASGNGRSGLLLDALKEELFALESERAAGKISAEEYKKHKDALDVTLARALTRK
jgi:5-hydroxyisourate hydrolase-like protein (transthyretin family)